LVNVGFFAIKVVIGGVLHESVRVEIGIVSWGPHRGCLVLHWHQIHQINDFAKIHLANSLLALAAKTRPFRAGNFTSFIDIRHLR